MIVRRVISGYPASALVTSDYCHAPDWSFENVIIAVSVDYIKAQEFRFGFCLNGYLWHELVWILLHFCSFQQKKQPSHRWSLFNIFYFKYSIEKK